MNGDSGQTHDGTRGPAPARVRHPGGRRRLVRLALALSAVAPAVGCRSQATRRADVQAIQLTDMGGYLEFVARQRERDQKSKVGAGDTRAKETILEESVRLEIDGYTYHPNFLEFSLGGLFGLLQQSFEEDFSGRDRSSSDDGTIIEFDLDGHFFKKKEYPGSVFARRYRALEARPFQPSIETTTTNYGVLWQYVSERMPTSFQFSHNDVRLEPLSKEEEDGRQTDTQFRFETGYRFSDHNALSFVYNRQSVEQEPFKLDYDLDEMTLSHRLDFGEGHRHRLDSEFNLYDQRGTFDIERWRWREILRLQHTENLRTWYQLEVLDRTQGSLSGVPPIQERSYLLSGALEHQLYESLLTQLTGFVQKQEFEAGADIDRMGAQASFDYRKKNPWGELVADYRARLQREERSGGDVLAEVIDERRTFRDPQPVVLTNPRISTSSIFITAEDSFTAYQIGRDYTVRRIGDEIEIERVPTGFIEDGETVLIDYTFNLGGDFTLETVAQDFGIRQNFDFGLSPYYRLRWQDQTISPQEATGAVADDITANILGVEFRRWSLRLVAEYEDHDSTINPFQAIRLTADYTHRFDFGATGIVKARWSDFNYDPPNERETRFFTVEGRYRHPITSHLTVEGVALYREEQDSLSGDDQGIDVDLSLEWLVRQTEVRVTYEFGAFEDDFSENDYSALYVQVRRSF